MMIARYVRPLAPTLLTVLAGCSNGSTGDEPGDGSSGADANTGTQRSAYFELSPDVFNDCFPRVLPTASDGMVACRVLFYGVPNACAESSLSPATTEDSAGISRSLERSGAPADPANVCVVDQLPAAVDAGACADAATPGWCYVAGSCASSVSSQTCPQSLCATNALLALPIAYSGAFLACP